MLPSVEYKQINQLYVLSMDENKIHIDSQVKQEMDRLKHNLYSPSLPFLSPCDNSTNILFHNCRSLHKYIAHVRTDGSIPAAGILILCETRFASNDTSSSTCIQGFHHTYHNTSAPSQHSHRLVHGTSIYSRQPFDDTYPQVHNKNGIELTLFKTTELPNVLIIAIYRPPRVPLSDLIKQLTQILEIHHFHTSLTQPTIIIGDFNVNTLEPNEGKQLHNLLFAVFKYRQLIHAYTTDNRTAIDHIYTNAPTLVADCGVLESYFSDHKPIWIACSKTPIARLVMQFSTICIKFGRIFKYCLSSFVLLTIFNFHSRLPSSFRTASQFILQHLLYLFLFQ